MGRTRVRLVVIASGEAVQLGPFAAVSQVKLLNCGVTGKALHTWITWTICPNVYTMITSIFLHHVYLVKCFLFLFFFVVVLFSPPLLFGSGLEGSVRIVLCYNHPYNNVQ